MKRIDLILSEARKQDMKVILTLGNYEDQFGGIQWYVDQLLGSGHDKEEFYSNSQTKDAYRNYVSHVVYRTNSINGIQYKDDTTILSWELLVSCLNWLTCLPPCFALFTSVHIHNHITGVWLTCHCYCIQQYLPYLQ